MEIKKSRNTYASNLLKDLLLLSFLSITRKTFGFIPTS